MKQQCTIVCLLFVLCASPVFSDSGNTQALVDLLGGERAAELIDRGTLTVFQQRTPQLNLAPRHGFTLALAGDMLRALDASFLVESLSAYRKPPKAARGAWSEAERTALYNGALALSSLTGLQYFSISRNAMRTFYETSAVIDGPATRRTVVDPVVTLPPAELTIYARQKDLTFGDNIYKYQYHALPGALFFIQTNVTAMNAGIVPAVGKEKLRSVIAVIDAGDYLLIYVASMAKAASFPGMNQRVGASFSTRTEAILGWFAGQAGRAFATD